MKTSIQTGIAWTLTLLGVVIILETNWQAHAGSTISKYKSYICAWWAADANTQDSLGKHNGSLENGTGYLPGIRGMAFNFNSCAKNYVKVPCNETLEFGTDDFTIQTWVNFRSWVTTYDYDRPDAIFLGVDEGSGETSKWFFGFHAEKLTFHINSPTLGAKWALDAPFTPETNTWYNLVLTRQSGVFKVYVNGVLVGTDDSLVNVPIPAPNAPLTIGQAEELGFIDGMIDETAIYMHALTASQIQKIYQIYVKKSDMPPRQSL